MRADGAQGLSDSTLYRYERAERVIHVKHAELLDRHYGTGNGWLREAIVRLNSGTWQPWRDESPRLDHYHTWPPEYVGSVWVCIRPNPRAINQEHRVVLLWGSWRRDVGVVLGEDGLSLTTGKGMDRTTVLIEVRVQPMAHVLFGVDEQRAVGPTLDIRKGWVSRD